MRVHAESQISREDQKLFQHIRTCLAELPEIVFDKRCGKNTYISCHLLARAVGMAFFPYYKLEVIDGKFLGIFDHSWLETENGNIIDVYPVGAIGGPILWDGQGLLLTSQLYKRLNTRELGRMKDGFMGYGFSRAKECIQLALEVVIEKKKLILPLPT